MSTQKPAMLRSHLRTYAMVFALVAIWIIFQYQTDGAFLQARNLSNLLRQMSVTGTIAGGMVLIIVAGQIDLSVGSVVAFLGGLMAVLNAQKGWGPGAAVAATFMMGGLIGLAQGYLHAFQAIPAFIVTLGGMMAFRGASMWITSNSTIPLESNWIQNIGTAYVGNREGWILTIVTLCLVGIKMFRDRIQRHRVGLEVSSLLALTGKLALISSLALASMWVFASYEGIPLPVLIMLAILGFIHFFGTQTLWGRHIYAIGGNVEAAFLSGIPVKIRVLTIFILMGFLSTIGGIILTTRVGSASPDAGQLLELDAIASCVIGGTSLMGGKGTAFGALLGALVIESLNNGMSLANMEPFWQFILKGLVLVAAVWVDVVSRGKN